MIDLGHGVTYEWLAEDRVVNFRLNHATRGAIDAWINEVDRLSSLWDGSRPWLGMHEIAQIPLTPYLRQRIEGIVTKYPDMHGRTCAVLRPSVFSNLIRLFAERELKRRNPRMLTRVFTSREAALKWLLED